MQYEVSAGGVVVSQDKSQVLLLKDKGGNWTFPKGLVEKGEDTKRAAAREIGEEVGLKQLKLVTSLTPIEYFYRWEGALKKKTVYYFLFTGDINESPTPQLEEGIMEVRWFTLTAAQEILGYKKTNVKVLEEAAQKNF